MGVLSSAYLTGTVAVADFPRFTALLASDILPHYSLLRAMSDV